MKRAALLTVSYWLIQLSLLGIATTLVLWGPRPGPDLEPHLVPVRAAARALADYDRLAVELKLLATGARAPQGQVERLLEQLRSDAEQAAPGLAPGLSALASSAKEIREQAPSPGAQAQLEQLLRGPGLALREELTWQFEKHELTLLSEASLAGNQAVEQAELTVDWARASVYPWQLLAGYTLPDLRAQPLVARRLDLLRALPPDSPWTILEAETASADFAERSARHQTRLLTTPSGPDLRPAWVALMWLVGLAFPYALARRLKTPISRLKEATVQVAAGDLDVRVDLPPGDELGELADAFNQMSEDIKLSQERILSAKEYTERILRSIGNMLIIMTPDGVIQAVNAAACETLGYAEDELLGASFEKLISEHSPANNLLFTGSRRHIEATYRSRSGEDIPVYFSCSIVRDDTGRIQSIVTVAQDISERKKAEGALAESEERFRAIFASAAIGIARLELDMTLSHSNRAMEKILGFETGLLTGQRLESLLSPVDVYSHRGLFQELLTGKRESYQIENPYMRQQGGLVWGNAIVSLVRDEERKPAFAIFMLEDITGRKEAEEDLAKARHTLEEYASSLEEKETRLRKLLERLITSQEEERRLVANDLHDGILQYVIAAEMHLTAFSRGLGNEVDSANLKRGLERLRSAVTEGRRLIFNLRPSTLDDFGLIDTLKRHIRDLEEDVDCSVDFSADLPDQPLPPAMETTVYRIVQEALNNAKKHAAPEHVDVELSHTGEEFRIRVSDDGRGFDLDSVMGEGIGMSAMRERAELAGGWFDIESSPGGGTVITAGIPFLTEPALVDSSVA